MNISRLCMRIRNLHILYKCLINNRSLEYLADKYKIKEASVHIILRKQLTDYNFHILGWNRFIELHVKPISFDGLDMDEEFMLINYIHERVLAIRSIIIREEE